MMKDDSIYLEHILQSILSIAGFVEGLTLEDFQQNKLVQDATIRNLEIIGEATKNLSQGFRQKHAQIEWKKIAGMRDKLIHHYMGVDVISVWQVLIKDLPNLEGLIRDIIDKY